MSEPRQVYRSRTARMLFVPTVVVAVLGVAGSWWAVSRGGVEDIRGPLLLYTPLAMVWCFLLYRMWRSYIEVRPGAITVRNTFGPMYEVPWDDIDSFDEGHSFWGIDLVLHTGGRITMNAVQKSTLARWTNTTTRADGIVDELNDYLDEFTGGPR